MVSNKQGHLDFGGNGFLRVSEELISQGHSLSWMAGDITSTRLKARGHHVLPMKSILPVPNPENCVINKKRMKTLFNQIEQLRVALIKDKPDLCLLDRNLGPAAMVLTSLNIPYVSMGTPGGYWERDPSGVKILSIASDSYRKLGRLMCTELAWLKNHFDSWWQPSPYLNIVFMGRSFYPAHANEKTSAFVNVSDNSANYIDANIKRDRLGIALGHTGDVKLPLVILDTLNDKIHQTFGGVDIFAGGRPDILEKLKKTYPSCRVYDWTPYDQIFPSLKKLICFGGVGTLWHSIQHRIPSIVIAGGAGDQKINAEQIQRLGMGMFWDGSIQKIPDLFESKNVSSQERAFSKYHCEDNYTDNLKTLVVKLENIARMQQI